MSNSVHGEIAEEQILFTCANCKRYDDSEDDKSTLKLCSGCYKVKYCNRECQLVDRRNHKVDCSKAGKTINSNSTKKVMTKDLNDLLYYCDKGDLEGLQREISNNANIRAASNEQLFTAFSNLMVGRFYECVELLLLHNANPNVHDADGWTLLLIACQEGYEDFVSLFLRHNVNPNGENKYGTSPLHAACKNGHDKCVSLLLQHNANSHLASHSQYSPLHEACQNGHDKCVSLLLQHNAEPNNVNNEYGYSPLHLACQYGHENCVSLLLQYNAELNSINKEEDCSPLHLACQYGHDKCVSLLLQHNAQPNNVNNEDGYSPLHFACQNGHDKCVSLLLQHNAELSIAISCTFGYLPLHLACQNGHDKCVSLLLQHNADPNIVSINDGTSPLHVASRKGHDKCVSVLLQHNADPNTIYTDGISPLHLACQYGHDKCVSLLLQHNAEPNIVDNINNATPLFTASQHCHDKCVSLLLHAGGNTEHVSKSGYTPFLVACIRGYLKCAAVLVEHGANIHARNVTDLYSALYSSCLSKNVNLVTYVISLGVDVNVPSSNGSTPLQYCHAYGLEECVQLLIEHGADESTMTTPLPAELPTDQASIENQRDKHCNYPDCRKKDDDHQPIHECALCKAVRKKAKHCDYPDCCNEGDDSQPLHACSSCRAVYYCSREHQEAHWKAHRKLCKAIKK